MVRSFYVETRRESDLSGAGCRTGLESPRPAKSSLQCDSILYQLTGFRNSISDETIVVSLAEFLGLRCRVGVKPLLYTFCSDTRIGLLTYTKAF